MMIGVRGWMVEVRSSGLRVKDLKRAVGYSWVIGCSSEAGYWVTG